MQAFPAAPGAQLPSLQGATVVLVSPCFCSPLDCMRSCSLCIACLDMRWLQPAVAVGNVGELCVDALISSLRAGGEGACTLAGRINDPNLLPAVGNDPFDLAAPGSLATELELYGLQGTNTYILQQRAPAMTGRQRSFAENVATWLHAQGVAQLLLISGLDAQSRRDSQILGPQIR
jgi:proteasome assembly chaperone 2